MKISEDSPVYYCVVADTTPLMVYNRFGTWQSVELVTSPKLFETQWAATKEIDTGYIDAPEGVPQVELQVVRCGMWFESLDKDT